jgi:hypothetical protein
MSGTVMLHRNICGALVYHQLGPGVCDKTDRRE